MERLGNLDHSTVTRALATWIGHEAIKEVEGDLLKVISFKFWNSIILPSLRRMCIGQARGKKINEEEATIDEF